MRKVTYFSSVYSMIFKICFFFVDVAVKYIYRLIGFIYITKLVIVDKG